MSAVHRSALMRPFGLVGPGEIKVDRTVNVGLGHPQRLAFILPDSLHQFENIHRITGAERLGSGLEAARPQVLGPSGFA
jgi:hypothetical protein